MTLVVHQPIVWRCRTVLERYAGNDLTRDPLAIEVAEGNLLVAGGANAIFHRLIGGTSVAAFSSANAYIGVGNSTTAAAVGQTDLQASSGNTARRGMEAGFPTHTDGTASSSPLIFRSVFPDTAAVFVWNEFGLFNASSGGRMLNRKVQSFNGGVAKPNTESWALNVTLTVS